MKLQKEVLVIAYSTKLSDAIHILSYIYIFKEKDLSSLAISKSIKTNPTVVRRLMAKLKKAEIIRTASGKAKPSLTRDPSEITFYDIYRAVEEESSTFFHVNPETNTECPEGAVIQDVLKIHYDSIQEDIEESLTHHKLSDVIAQVNNLGQFA